MAEVRLLVTQTCRIAAVDRTSLISREMQNDASLPQSLTLEASVRCRCRTMEQFRIRDVGVVCTAIYHAETMRHLAMGSPAAECGPTELLS
jgi:hypothetical protein